MEVICSHILGSGVTQAWSGSLRCDATHGILYSHAAKLLARCMADVAAQHRWCRTYATLSLMLPSNCMLWHLLIQEPDSHACICVSTGCVSAQLGAQLLRFVSMLLKHALMEGATKSPVQRRRMQHECLWPQRAEVCMQSSRAVNGSNIFQHNS